MRLLSLSAIAIVLVSGTAAAEAIDRLEPAERGSVWLANESLDFRGSARTSFGYTMTYARRPFVVGEGEGPVADLVVAHLGGTMVFVERLRLGLDVPFQVYAGGRDAAAGATLYDAPARDDGFGDVRVSGDVRLFGRHDDLVIALGVRGWAPTGSDRQWSSDGVFRGQPRLLVAGERGAFVWAAQAGVELRADSRAGGALAAGVKPVPELVIGPEIFASTMIAPGGRSSNDDRARSSIEALVGAHWLVQRTARIGGAIGAGVGDGAPAFRATIVLDWAPEPGVAPGNEPAHGHAKPARKPDTDRDGIADDVDACPEVVGVRTDDPTTTGCPPDADGDGIDDLEDACPTQRGLRTDDPSTTGCPDRDRDGDGIPNDIDACPDHRGPVDVDPKRSGCPRAFATNERIVVLDPIAFEGTTAKLVHGTVADAILTAVLAAVLDVPSARGLHIEGHTDGRGDPQALKRLGAARAEAVASWLVEHGIERARITTEGVGGEKPLATNETEAGRAENRRIEIVLRP